METTTKPDGLNPPKIQDLAHETRRLAAVADTPDSLLALEKSPSAMSLRLQVLIPWSVLGLSKIATCQHGVVADRIRRTCAIGFCLRTALGPVRSPAGWGSALRMW